MESWVLEGGDYSFLRSAPHNFNLRHRDGPNRVEIFDITSIPSSRSAISETTCLCDIFGDDSESPSLSSSPASTSCLKRDVEPHLPAEDVNDSSGSYHSAHSLEQLSDTSDTFEDSKDAVSLKHTKNLLSPETGEPTDLTSPNDKPAYASENGSRSPPEVEDSDRSQQKCNLSQDNTPIQEPENIDSSAQQLVMSESQYRDSNVTVTDLSQDTIPSDRLSETCIPEQNDSVLRDTPPKEREESTPPKEQESPFSDDQLYTVTHEPLDTSSLEITKSETSCEETNKVNNPEEKDARVSSPDIITPTEEVSHLQEAVQSDCSTSPGNRDPSPIQSHTSTPDPSIRALTPNLKEISSSPAHMDTSSLSESCRLLSTPSEEDTAWLSEESTTAPSPALSSEENEEIIFHSTASSETTEVADSPESGRLSFLSDTSKEPGSLDVSEFCSDPDSLLATHSPEASVVIHSPVGYTISPSPEFERKVVSAESEALSSIPEIPETDYAVTPTDYRGSVSSPDSKLCLTPESRSITSTPESRQHFLTPDSTPAAPSPELISAACSPEITAVTCSVLAESSKSPQIEGITYRVVPPQENFPEQYADEEDNAECLTIHPTDEIRNLANSTMSNLSVASEDTSRPSSTTFSIPRDATPSPELRDQRLAERCSDHIPVPEPCNSLGQRDSYQSTTEEVDLPSVVPVDQDQFGGFKEPIEICSSDLDDGKDSLGPIQITNHSISESPVPKTSIIQMDESAIIQMNDSLLNTHEKPNSPNLEQTSSKTAPITEEGEFLEGNDGSSGTEVLEGQSVGSESSLGHRPRETPQVFHCDSDRKCDEPCRNKGWSEERVVQEEDILEKEAENIAEGSYREEQVELSFSDRNRKEPASYSAAPSSGDPKSGIPARCYFESPLTTRQQQSLLRAQGVQKENKSGARKVQSAFQIKHSGAGPLPSGCIGEISSMGSEFDEADNEVKWLTDLAFRSLSSPQGEYLDVYSSSHRSSTNVSQPSTVNSSGASTWMSYADLRGTALHENDDRLCHTSSFLPHGTLDPTNHFEMGSFECVDVALESKEESRRGKKTVPKRQIQLKRRNPEESKPVENAGNVLDSPVMQRRSRDTLFRQHSTPAADSSGNTFEGELESQTNKKMLQKSASFEETSTKTKMASCIIKSVLSKKIETDTKEPSRSEDSNLSEDKKKHPETLSVRPSSNLERHSLSSNLPYEGSESSEDFAGREERSPHIQKKCGPKVPPKPFFKANFIPTYSNTGIVTLQGKTSGSDQLRPRMIDPFESKIQKKQTIKEADPHSFGDKDSCDSTTTTARHTSCIATRAASAHSRIANRDLEDHAMPETNKQQHCRRMFLSKTPEITLKPGTIKDKKKSSLKVSLSPDQPTEDSACEFHSQETPGGQIQFKQEENLENKEDDDKMKQKPVMHKVRDVRKLVKNTYSLSFKASNTTLSAEDQVTQNNTETQPQVPHALHIECKAVSWKDKQASGHKTSNVPEAHDNSETKRNLDKSKDNNITEKADESFLPRIKLEPKKANVQVSDTEACVVSKQCNTTSTTSESCEQSTNLEMPPTPASKEISAVLFLQDGTPDATQKPASPATSDAMTHPMSSSHSVSMLLKEKGMQADIGVCEITNEGTSATAKHINRLEVPLQICASDCVSTESRKGKKEESDVTCEQKTSTDSTLQACQSVSLLRSSPKPKELRISSSETLVDSQSQAATLQPLKKEEKMTNHATSMTKFQSSRAEVRSISSNTKSHAKAVTTSKEIELPIQVRSISSDRPKPSVPLKPSYKQPFTEIRSMSSDFPKTDITPTTSIFKQQTHVKSDVKKNETSAAMTHREQSTEAASSNTKKFAVSAVSSYKLPSIPATTVSDTVQNSTTISVGADRQQVSTTSVQSSSNQQQQNVTVSQEQVMPSSHIVLPVASQSHNYKQPLSTASVNNQLHKDDFHLHASDDPPSYDERESFSPLLLSDLPPRRVNRYHPNNKQSPCSCPTASHPHLGHPYHGSQNRTPPAPPSPGQGLPYSGAPPQAQVRPHQCRQDSQPLNYPSASPKTTVPQAPAMIQPLHHSYTCPAPVPQAYGDEQQPPPSNQMDRHSANRPSPHAASGAAYCVHSRSPNMALDPRSQFFSPHDLPPTFGHDYGSEGPGSAGVLYPENASGLEYGQGPRRVLLDPETGKYFYIEVPMQPLRKMLFDPEIGQYVEVLIPQQATSHSGMYSSNAAPYSSIHGPGLYTPQYLPYAAPLHSQPAQQPRHPESTVSTTLHRNSMGYGSSASQAPKSDAKGHPSLDQNYLESMYYIPTGMNASPNSTPSDCFHKRSPNMPATGGRRA